MDLSQVSGGALYPVEYGSHSLVPCYHVIPCDSRTSLHTHPLSISFHSSRPSDWPNYSLHISPLIVGTGYTHISAPPSFHLTIFPIPLTTHVSLQYLCTTGSIIDTSVDSLLTMTTEVYLVYIILTVFMSSLITCRFSLFYTETLFLGAPLIY